MTAEIWRCFCTTIWWIGLRTRQDNGRTTLLKASKTIAVVILFVFSMTSWLARFVHNLYKYKKPCNKNHYILTLYYMCCVLLMNVMLWQVDESIYHGQTRLLSHLLKVLIRSDIKECGLLTNVQFRWAKKSSASGFNILTVMVVP